MLKIFFDHDFNHHILRGLEKRIANLDYVTPNILNNITEKDKNHLIWAAKENRVIVTHDVNTFIQTAKERIIKGEKMFGLIAVPQSMPIGQAIDELETIIICSGEDEYENLIIFLPHI